MTPLAFAAVALGSLPAQSFDFAKQAQAYLAAHPLPAEAAQAPTLRDVIDAHFVRAEVGAFDLHFPRAALGEKSRAATLARAARAVADAHVAWLDWTGASGAGAERARADASALSKWLASARLAAGAERASDFLRAFVGYDTVAEAVVRLRADFRSAAALGFEPHAYAPQELAFAPTRQDFVDLAALVGHFEEAARSTYWHDGILGWTEIAWNDLQIVALQYPPVRPRGDDLRDGEPMDGREPTGLEQHVAQRAVVSLAWHALGRKLDPAFELGIAQAVVVDIYGQNNTRSGGGGRGAQDAGMVAFIPGGNSAGGALPPSNLDSAWRGTLGADYFVKPLKDSQKVGAKAGAKEKDEKNCFFQIRSDDTSERQCVRAPFFGSVALGKELPPRQFLQDYLEFFRAYRAAFAHWLRDESATKREESRALLATLLRRCEESGYAATFEEVVSEVYGVPFSSKEAAADCLENRFLAWLAKR